MKKRLWTEESGATMVLVAWFMVCIVALGALAVDLGTAYVKAADLQTAADAAAFAAGELMPVSDTDASRKLKIENTAAEYLKKNGIEDNYSVKLGDLVKGRYNSLKIEAGGHVKTNFAGLFGVSEIPLKKTTEVKTVVCARLSDVVPLSLSTEKLQSCLAAGERTGITLKFGGGSGTTGGFGAIDLDGVRGGGANDFENWLSNGFEGELEVGSDLYPVESGNMAGPTKRAFLERYNVCEHFPGEGGCTHEHYVANCPRVIKVPIVEYINNKNVQIAGFAAFVLEPQASDETDTITGSYVDMVTLGSAGGDATGLAADYGVYSLMLTQ